MVHVQEVGALGAVAAKAVQKQMISAAVNKSARSDAARSAGLPQAIINSSNALRSRAGLSAANAKSAKAASTKLQRVAQVKADEARAAIAVNDSQKAGAAIVQHLTALREAFVAEGSAVKAQRAAVAQAKAANTARTAEKLREAATTAQASGNVPAAKQLEARAVIAERQKVLDADAAATIASTPLALPMPAELTEQAIATVGERYAVRVARRDGAQFQHSQALIAMLGDMSRESAGFRSPAAILAEYGGGPIGLMFTGAELGHVGTYNRGVGALGNWFTDGLKEIGKNVGLDVDAIEKGFNDIGSTITGAAKQGEQVVKNIQSALNPPTKQSNKIPDVAVDTINRNTSKMPEMPQVKLPTGTPSIGAKPPVVGGGALSPIDQRLTPPTRMMGTGTKIAIGVGAVGLFAAIAKAMRG